MLSERAKYRQVDNSKVMYYKNGVDNKEAGVWIFITCGAPNHQSRTWSHTALDADIALDSLRALSTAAPRPWTVCSHTVVENYWLLL